MCLQKEIVVFIIHLQFGMIQSTLIIYKKSKDEQYILICKNQTCSQKLKNITEINNYLNERSI